MAQQELWELFVERFGEKWNWSKPSLELTSEVLERGNEVLNKGSKSAPERINTKDICITNRIWQLVVHKRIE